MRTAKYLKFLLHLEQMPVAELIQLRDFLIDTTDFTNVRPSPWTHFLNDNMGFGFFSHVERQLRARAIEVLPDRVQAGDYAWNKRTDEIKLIVEANEREALVSGAQKWESTKNWVPTGRHLRLTPTLVELHNVNNW